MTVCRYYLFLSQSDCTNDLERHFPCSWIIEEVQITEAHFFNTYDYSSVPNNVLLSVLKYFVTKHFLDKSVQFNAQNVVYLHFEKLSLM